MYTLFRTHSLDGNGVIDITGDAETNEVLQENQYHPFGMNQEEPWMEQTGRGNAYQYNGKELNEDFGLNWYHYGARMYDPAIGRFIGVDPIADEFPWVNPFNYAENSPIANIDLWGLQKFYSADDGNIIGKFGDSNEERVITGKKNIDLAQEVFSNGESGKQ